MRRPWWLVIPLLAVVGCGDETALSNEELTDAQLDAVLEAATLTRDDLPDSFEWEASEDNPAYLDSCAETAAELADSAPDAVTTEPPRSFAGDRTGDAGDLSDPSFVGVIGVSIVFATEAAAATSFKTLDEGAFMSCVKDGIANDAADFEDGPASAGVSDAIDFDVGSESLGDESTLHSAHFPATVVGGYDDFEEIDLSVTRLGPAVVAVAVWASAQNLSREATGDVTLDIAASVADQVPAALD